MKIRPAPRAPQAAWCCGKRRGRPRPPFAACVRKPIYYPYICGRGTKRFPCRLFTCRSNKSPSPKHLHQRGYLVTPANKPRGDRFCSKERAGRGGRPNVGQTCPACRNADRGGRPGGAKTSMIVAAERSSFTAGAPVGVAQNLLRRARKPAVSSLVAPRGREINGTKSIDRRTWRRKSWASSSIQEPTCYFIPYTPVWRAFAASGLKRAGSRGSGSGFPAQRPTSE